MQSRNMEIMKKYGVTILLIGIVFSSFAQKSMNYNHRMQEFNAAKELFDNKKYSAAQHAFNQFMERQDINDAILKEDAEYYAAISAMKLYNRDVNHLIETYIRNHPESPKINQASFQLANHYFRETKYRSALKWYDKVDKRSLREEQISEYYFKTGFCHYARKDYSKADKAFYEIYDKSDFYSPLAKYFYSHIKYINKQYQTALEGFIQLGEHELFAKIVPFYITQIYHLQKEYNKVLEYAPAIFEHITGERTNEIARIIAEAYFQTGKYDEALTWLKKYEENTDELSDTDYYQIGFAYFRNGQYNQAETYLKEVIGVEDSLTQNAAYHLAKCYIEMDDKNRAKTAFGIASSNDFDSEISENALFNYAKLCFELDYSPFADAINAFNKFITQYPKSIYTDDAYEYLLQAILSTKNYEKAMQVIDAINNKTPEIYAAYQRLAYFRALEYFSDLDFENVIIFLDKSLTYKQYDTQIKALSYYWKADALYRQKKYNQSVEVFKAFLTSSGAINLPEYGKAYYNVGYAYFKQKNYSESSIWFRKYVDHIKGQNSEMLCDALNRIGDCYFVNSQFSPAITYYDKATQSCDFQVDYAFYQKALSQGREKKYNEKILTLHTLRHKFPETRYQPGAIFEIARTYHSNVENADSAIYYYNYFIDNYPNASQTQTALSSLANLYFNKKDYDSSLAIYKSIVAKYPDTNESIIALEMIKTISVEMNNPEYYVEYVETEGVNTDISEFEKDSLVFESAEKLFSNNDIDAAIPALERYLNKYPNGHYSLEANYYLAQSYFSLKDYQKALKPYQYVISKPTNTYSEESLLKAAGICYDNKDYTLALEYYTSLSKTTQQASRIKIADIGIMRSAWFTEDYEALIPVAHKLLVSNSLSDAEIRESHYKLAKSYYAIQEINKALSHFSELSNEVTSYEGGESKYFVAKIHHEMKNDSLAENTVIEFTQQNSPHRFWLAKAFILLADIYIEKGEYFQATHILQSLLDNYTDETDGIKEEAREKQMTIRALEETKAMQDKNMRLPKPALDSIPTNDTIQINDSINNSNVEQEIPEDNE
jgi:TolA-binding protein